MVIIGSEEICIHYFGEYLLTSIASYNQHVNSWLRPSSSTAILYVQV